MVKHCFFNGVKLSSNERKPLHDACFVSIEDDPILNTTHVTGKNPSSKIQEANTHANPVLASVDMCDDEQ